MHYWEARQLQRVRLAPVRAVTDSSRPPHSGWSALGYVPVPNPARRRSPHVDGHRRSGLGITPRSGDSRSRTSGQSLPMPVVHEIPTDNDQGVNPDASPAPAAVRAGRLPRRDPVRAILIIRAHQRRRSRLVLHSCSVCPYMLAFGQLFINKLLPDRIWLPDLV